MTRIIGMATVNEGNLIGSIYTAIVVVDSNFQREFPNVDSFFNPQWVLMARKKIIRFEIARITPNHMHLGIPTLLNEQYGNLINRIEKFWQDTEIYHGIEGLEPKLPVQVKRMEKVEKDLIKYNPHAYVNKVAKQFALMELFKECVEIKQTYGDFGKGTADDPVTIEFIKNNPTNIWVRKHAKKSG